MDSGDFIAGLVSGGSSGGTPFEGERGDFGDVMDARGVGA